MDSVPQRKLLKLVSVLTHAIIWGSLLSIPFLPDLWDNRVVDLPLGMERAIKATIVLLVVVVFYVSYVFLAPRYFFTKRYGTYVLSTLGVMLAGLAACWLVGRSITFADPSFTRSVLPVLVALFIIFTLASVAGTGLRMIIEWRRLKEERDALELERSKSELAALRARVDPHYLFNSLNTIYALAHRKDERTEGAVLQLSTLMRYVLTAGGKDRVPLENEVEHIKAFMDFQKLRSGELVRAELTTNGDLTGIMIDPLLLQPFVENAYKHGVSAHEPSPIRVELDVIRGLVIFHVSNRIHREQTRDASTGNGLVSVRRRLELKYPDKHTLGIRTENGEHRIDLTIDLS